MAKLLFIEDDQVALKAMDGIIRRSPHEIICVSKPDEAWALLIQSLEYDVIVTELKLSETNTLPLIKQIREHPYLKTIPIIVYSKVNDKKIVRAALDLGVQNYLFKPYKEKLLFDEVKKQLTKNWRIQLSGDPVKFFIRLDIAGGAFHGENKYLLAKMESLYVSLQESKTAGGIRDLEETIEALAVKATKSVYTTFAELITNILNYARAGELIKANALIEVYPQAVVLQRYRLGYIEKELKISPSKNSDSKDAGIQDNSAANDKNRVDNLLAGDGLTLEEVDEKLEKVTNYPVIESAAAAFQMVSHNEDTDLGEIVDMIQRDAGLATSVLRFSNLAAISPSAIIADIHQAISVIGLKRVRLLALSLKTVPEVSSMFTAIKWEDFWTHQVGCAILAEEIATQFEIPARTEVVYVTGLMHDIGKVLLNEVDPGLYKAVVAYSRDCNEPLQLCEQKYFGCSHEHAGLTFAKNSRLPEALQTAIEFQFKPNSASSHRDVVGVVSLANYLCMKYKIGDNGDRIVPGTSTLTTHPAWTLLEPWIATGFSISRFTREIELRINTLKIELAGLIEEKTGRSRQ